LNAETSSKMIENDARWYIFQVSSSHVFYHFAGSAMVFRGMTRRGSIVQVCIAALPDGELKRIKDSFATGYPQSRNWWLCCCYQWPSKDVSSVTSGRHDQVGRHSDSVALLTDPLDIHRSQLSRPAGSKSVRYYGHVLNLRVFAGPQVGEGSCCELGPFLWK
jgi:hypothetical protein